MGRIRQGLRNLSIKKTFMLYMLVFLLLATLLSAVTINFADHMRNSISLAYVDSGKRIYLEEADLVLRTPESGIQYTPEEKAAVNLYDFIQTWSIPVYFGICIVLSSLLFYRNKLKKPIEVLEAASAKIAEQDLGFRVVYDSRDEMGRLCSSFDKMRASLEENNREMWRAMEERKRLNAAFAHDLRTPLTVLRGYSDFLILFL